MDRETVTTAIAPRVGEIASWNAAVWFGVGVASESRKVARVTVATRAYRGAAGEMVGHTEVVGSEPSSW